MQSGYHLFLPLMIVGLAYAQKPELVLELSATNVTVGDQLNASCTGQTMTTSRVLYINGESIRQRISVDRWSALSSGTTTTWFIDPIQPGDAGEYHCFAGGEQGSHVDSPPQNLTVYIPPSAKLDSLAGPTEMEDGRQASSVHQLVGFGTASALFILLLILTCLLVYVIYTRRDKPAAGFA